MKVERIAILIILTAMPSVFVWAGKTQQYPVQVVFRDAAGDAIRSDGLGAYVDGVDGVQALIIDDRGRLSLFACVASRKSNVECPGPRGIFFDFTEPADDVLGTAADPGPSSLGLPFATAVVDANLAVNLIDINDEYLADGLLGMTEAGEQRLARLKSNSKDSGGVLYTVRFRPGTEEDSNWVLVTFNGGQIPCDETVSCASWTVEAWTGVFTEPGDMCCPTNELYDIGTLVSDNTNDEGDYHLPFLMTITALPSSGDGGSGGGGGGKGKGGGNN